MPAGNGGAPDGGSNSLRGTVVVASFLGVSIQYLVRAPGGEELTVFAQNLDGSEPDSFGPGREVDLTWDPHHTFVVAKEQTA
jgi:spermidine/putrescine transport system ATP-binding protein